MTVSSKSIKLRCAIYTRKSTDEGLDQDFNSLHAQREACEAFVKSQASLGWKLSPILYDDSGISGGTLERPALKRLLDDIKNGHIDVLVVYKIDRLTRSLTDFAKIVDIFDNKGTSFVSVTQQFNTTTSMGRLTLNVLLSFAQFEREVTAERIKDKVAASKKKGMWMGGIVPLGYKSVDKKLIVNDQEARTVQYLFKCYLELGSVKQLSQAAKSNGLVGRVCKHNNGKVRKFTPFGRGNLYHLLANPIYVGKIRHKNNIYEGLHEAIIDQELWDAVQNKLKQNTRKRLSRTNLKSAAILTSLIFDETGDRLSPVHATKNGVRYRYYISNRITHGRGEHKDGWRLPTKQLEQPILNILNAYLTNPLQLEEFIDLKSLTVTQHQTIYKAADKLAVDLAKSNSGRQRLILKSFLHRIELQPTKLIIELDVTRLQSLLTKDEVKHSAPNIKQIEISHRLRRRGVEAKLIMCKESPNEPNPDHHLIVLIAKAHRWLKLLTDGSVTSIGELAVQQNEDKNEISRFLPLAFLAPDIVEHILAGTHPVDLAIQKLRDTATIPSNWNKQRCILGFAA